MSILKELRLRVCDSPRRPNFLDIRDDQLESLVEEINAFGFTNLGITADSIRAHGARVLGIPLRIVQ
ncbi:hypothetical protein ACRAVF_19200 [Bradyrhizobium oligotrophicum S58]